jgi:hypothetical protein
MSESWRVHTDQSTRLLLMLLSTILSFVISLSLYGGGGLLEKELLYTKMATRGRLFTGIRIDDVEEDGGVPPSDGTSDSSHVFSTPVSQTTTQVEPDVGVGGLSKVGLFCVWEESDICCGVVGKVDGEGGGAPRFCTKNRDACRYSTHRDNKANVSCYTYYIQCPRANTARLHPSLSMVCMEVPNEDDFPELETWLQPMDVWVTYINAINEHEAMNKAGAATARKVRASSCHRNGGGGRKRAR